MKWLFGILAVMAIMHFFFRRAQRAAQAEADDQRRQDAASQR